MWHCISGTVRCNPQHLLRKLGSVFTFIRYFFLHDGFSPESLIRSQRETCFSAAAPEALRRDFGPFVEKQKQRMIVPSLTSKWWLWCQSTSAAAPERWKLAQCVGSDESQLEQGPTVVKEVERERENKWKKEQIPKATSTQACYFVTKPIGVQAWPKL